MLGQEEAGPTRGKARGQQRPVWLEPWGCEQEDAEPYCAGRWACQASGLRIA